MHGEDLTNGTAIIGMSGRFPGAANVEELWNNLCGGKIALRRYTHKEVNATIGAHDHASIPHLVKQIRSGTWIPAGFYLGEIDKFDAGFFCYSPSEAELLDPQQRLLMETAWAAIEDAGYVPDAYPGVVGIFAGTGLSRYFCNNVYSNREIMYSSRDLTAGIGNEPDYVTNRVAYKLNLTGPSISVQTACSTSLVAVHLACQSLLAGECEMSLAGGVFVNVPGGMGYLYQEGSMTSPDGQIRAFDSKAQGTVFADGGVAVVCLKRLEDAMRDGDHIYAVIRGSAVNNDGSVKVGYTAPGINGQVAVVSEALAVSGISPEDISYVETHGTGTPVGDPIEITALTKAWRAHTDKSGYCAIGSIKPNIGHLAPAAGVTSLIKAALAMKHGVIPPSVNYETPNPRIDFASSPFFVNDRLREWETEGGKRIAAVSSFGMGGTNAHVILEEAPALAERPIAPGVRFFPLSGRTAEALRQSARNLSAHLERHADINLVDVAHTLRHGRKVFDFRGAVVAKTAEELRAGLQALAETKPTVVSLSPNPGLVLMLCGQGSQYVAMGEGLYRALPVFRETLDDCFRRLKDPLGLDLHDLLFRTSEAERAAATEILKQTRIAQPVLFAFELAIARQLEAIGITPEAMIGHSLGEYVAACLAGVFTPEDALQLVVLRGELMQSMPTGSMLSVWLGASACAGYLDNRISLAADNGPASSVLSGPTDAIEALQARLETAGVPCRQLVTSHAFHSTMMQPMVQTFGDAVHNARPQPPQRPYISNITGDWITAEQATDPAYWKQHLLGTVRFRAGIETLLKAGHRYFAETGPGNALATFTRRIASAVSKADTCVVPLVRHPNETTEDHQFFRQALGQLWAAGFALDWDRVEPDEGGRRVSLPTYPFTRERHWIDPRKLPEGAGRGALGKQESVEQWFYVPSWRRQAATAAGALDALRGATVLLFADPSNWADALHAQLRAAGARVVRVEASSAFEQVAAELFRIEPETAEHYERLLDAVTPAAVLHAWNLTPPTALDLNTCDVTVGRAFYSPLRLLQATGNLAGKERIAVLTTTTEVNDVYPRDATNPAKATLIGVLLCGGFEYPSVASRNVDVTAVELTGASQARTLSVIVDELARLLVTTEPLLISEDKLVAYRDGFRWVAHYEPAPVARQAPPVNLRHKGTYLITGGLGGLGLEFADYLVERSMARVALMGRTTMPPKVEWDAWLQTHDVDDATSARIRKLRAIEAKGAEIMVLQADVVDLEQTRTAIAEVERAWGKVHGVIHAAGIAGGGIMQLRTRASVDKVLSPKIRGTLVLQAALADHPLDFFVLFSSLFAVVGGIGQVDYSAANNFMDAFARERSLRHGERVVSINWGGWSEVGMAADHGITAKRNEAPALPGTKDLAHPYLFTRQRSDENGARYLSYLRVQDHWALQEHRILGESVMPGTGLLEMVRAAFEDLSGSARVLLDNVYFFQPLMVPADGLLKVQVDFTAQGGRFAFECYRAQGGDKQLFVSGEIGAFAPAAQRVDLEGLRKTCTLAERRFDMGEPQVLQGEVEFLQLGVHWQVINRIELGPDALCAHLILPETLADDIGQFRWHPSLLDMATGPIIGHLLSRLNLDLSGEFLPFTYGRLEHISDIPCEVFTHVRFRGVSERKDSLHFDVTLYDAEGGELLRISDFTIKQVPPRRPGAATKEAAGIDYLDDSIWPAEGREVFDRILPHLNQPQWIISTQNLPTMLEKLKLDAIEATNSANRPKATFVRDAEGVVMPRNPVEAALAKVFEQVLGVAPISIHDNFFDLGGDSVMGIQIVAQARSHGIILKPNQLFEHQTVEALVAAIGSATQVKATDAAQTDPQEMDYYKAQLEAARPFAADTAAGPEVRELVFDGKVLVDMERVYGAFNTTEEDILLTVLVAALDPAHPEIGVLIGRMSQEGPSGKYAFPITLPTAAADHVEALKEVKARLRKVPREGVGFAALMELAQAALPQVGFVRWGNAGQPDAEPGWHDGQVLDVSARRNSGGLVVRLVGRGEAAGQLATLAERFRSELDALVAAAAKADGPGFTAADFQDADISEEDFKALLNAMKS